MARNGRKLNYWPRYLTDLVRFLRASGFGFDGLPKITFGSVKSLIAYSFAIRGCSAALLGAKPEPREASYNTWTRAIIASWVFGSPSKIAIQAIPAQTTFQSNLSGRPDFLLQGSSGLGRKEQNCSVEARSLQDRLQKRQSLLTLRS